MKDFDKECFEYVWDGMDQYCQNVFQIAGGADRDLEGDHDAKNIVFRRVCRSILLRHQEYERGPSWFRIGIGALILFGVGYAITKIRM